MGSSAMTADERIALAAYVIAARDLGDFMECALEMSSAARQILIEMCKPSSKHDATTKDLNQWIAGFVNGLP